MFSDYRDELMNDPLTRINCLCNSPTDEMNIKLFACTGLSKLLQRLGTEWEGKCNDNKCIEGRFVLLNYKKLENKL